MSRFAIATLVLLSMTLHVPDSHGEAPTLESLPLYPMVSDRVPDADATRLLELAQNIIDAFDDRSLFSAVGGFYQPEPVGQLIAGAAAVKKAMGTDATATNPAIVTLAGFYYRLNQVAETYYIVVALDDLGTPVDAGMPDHQKATAKAYTATMRALPKLNQRVPGLLAPYLKAHPNDADALRLMARHHAGNFEFKEANAYYDRLLKVTRTADDHFEAVRYAGYLQTERESDAALAALVKRFPTAAWRRFATKRRQTLGRSLVEAQKKLAANENESTRLNWVELVLRYLGGSSAGSYRAIMDAEKKYPSSGDVRIVRGVWLMGGASIQGATAVMEELDTTGMPVTRNSLIGSRMTLRFSQLYSLVTQGRIAEVAPLLDTIEKDRIAYQAKDRFASDMVAIYVSIFRKMLDDTALMAVLGGDGSSEDALPKVQKLAISALKKARKKYNSRLDLWRLQLLTDMLEDSEKAIKGLDAFLGRMDRAVREEDQANAQLLGVMALMVAGRRADGLPRLKAALKRVANLVGRFEKHDERLSSDTRMKLDECPKGGCMDRSRAYAYLGAIRNMLARHQPEDERDQWHADTVVALRKAERFVADRGSAGSTLHAQLMTHRCWALGQRSDQKATHQCIGDLLNRHSSLMPVRAIYAAMIASDPTRRLEAKQLFGVISIDESLSAGLRYDAFKWLALFAVSEDDQTELRKMVSSAIEERKGVTRFGQSLDYAAVVSEGAFNIGLGFGSEGEPIHQVTTTIDLWSIVTAPIDDAKLDSVVGGSAD